MNWTDELWPLVIQLYNKCPIGIKPIYSRQTVQLALELHIPPQELYKKMFLLRQPPTQSLQHLVDYQTAHPVKFERLCRQLRSLNGMGNANAFYEDVELHETFERDFRPVNARTAQMMGRPLFTPVMLIMILDLYFRLIPATMKVETPDVRELASLLDIAPQDVVDILEIFQYCDPFMQLCDTLMDPMFPPCAEVWRRYADAENPQKLSDLAHQLRAYWE